MSVNEGIRHNMQVEQLQSAANAETARANQAKELISYAQIDANKQIAYANLGATYAQLAEARRHNEQTEGFNLLNLSEVERTNKAKESLESEKLTEQSTHNRATEEVEGKKIALQETSQLLEKRRILNEEAKLAETKRSNQARERVANEQVTQGYLNTLLRAGISLVAQ